jgi:hypothetical protein
MDISLINENDHKVCALEVGGLRSRNKGFVSGNKPGLRAVWSANHNFNYP